METADVPPGSVVVGVDGSPHAGGALAWAARQAALEGRSLTLVHAAEHPGVSAADHWQLLAAATVSALHEHPQLSIHRVESVADPCTALLAADRRAAMIVVGARGRDLGSDEGYVGLGSVSAAVSKRASCPVVVRRTPDRSSGRAGVLVGVDGSDQSLPAVEFAFGAAASRACTLTVLHSYWDVPGAADGPLEVEPRADRAARIARITASIGEVRARFGHVVLRVRAVRGYPEANLAAASHEHDLVVVGHHATPGRHELMHGSVALSVVARSVCAVAVVPARALLGASA